MSKIKNYLEDIDQLISEYETQFTTAENDDISQIVLL